MLTKRNKILFSIVLLQALFFIGWFCLEANKLSDPKAKTILVKTLPVDPRDYISGNYLTLRYEFSNQWGLKKHNNKVQQKQGEEVFVVLKQENKWFVPHYISFERPKVREDQAVLKGKFLDEYGRIEYGIEKYFINEGLKEPDERKDKIEVWLIIDEEFKPRIKTIMVNDKEFK